MSICFNIFFFKKIFIYLGGGERALENKHEWGDRQRVREK